MTSYSLKYYDSVLGWQDVSLSGSTTIQGNTDSNDVVQHYFDEPFLAESLLIYPRTWHSSPVMRLGVFGCSLSHYQTTLLPNNYIGCYLSTELAGYDLTSYVGNVTTVEECIALCKQTNASFAGISGTRCACGNSVGHVGKVSASAYCQTRCEGNAEQFCGGSYTQSVYRVFGM